MAVAKNGRIYGTIGGGTLEYQAVKKPWNWQEQLPIMWKFDLGIGENSELGMVCGAE